MPLNSKLPPFLNPAHSPVAAITEGLSALAQRSGEAFKQAQTNNPNGPLNGALTDVAKNFRAAVAAQAGKFDLVTQEEFQVQRALLEKSIAKLSELSAKITVLEAQIAAKNTLETPEIRASSRSDSTPLDTQAKG